MTNARSRGKHRGLRLLTALLAAGLLLLAVVLPALAAAVGPSKLENPTVDPRTGTTSTPITFTVAYRNTQGQPPDYVRVVVAGAIYAMQASGADWKAGVVFTVRTTVPAGTNDVRFEARDAEKFVDQTSGGSISITAAPTPEPTPTPQPTQAPTPALLPPTPAPPPTSEPTPAPILLPASAATPAPTTSSGAAVVGRATPPPPPPPPTGGGGLGVVPPLSKSGNRGSGDGGSGADGAVSGPGSGSPASGGSAGGTSTGSSSGPTSWIGGSFDAGLAALGLQGPGHLPTIPTFILSTTAVVVWMSFMLFNKRRREDEATASDAVLQAAAAAGVAVAPGSGYVPPIDPESLMPRWRRPSLMEARRTDPIRSPAPERPRMSFAGAVVESTGASERRRVRYAVAPLLDRPDEILASRIGELAEGDEIQVEQRTAAYCEVLLPDGRRGWVHRTTLGDAIGASTSWNAIEEPQPDAENALAALLAARGLQHAQH